MENKRLMVGLGLGAAAAAAMGLALRPRQDRKMKKAVKTLDRVVRAVSGVMGW